MKRNSILASGAALTLFATVLAQGCSSDPEDPETMTPPLTGQGGTGTATGNGGTGTAVGNGGTGTAVGNGGTGTAVGNGGTGTVVANGGSPAAMGGSGGAATGMGGTGSAAPTTCAVSTSNGTVCSLSCIDPCGVFNIGTRLCDCSTGAAVCVSCGFADLNDPLIVPPTMALAGCVDQNAMPATDDIMEGLDQLAAYTCVENSRCQPTGAADVDRFCGCRGNEWDCDSKPDSFGAF